jgi:hypothetical protein
VHDDRYAKRDLWSCTWPYAWRSILEEVPPGLTRGFRRYHRRSEERFCSKIVKLANVMNETAMYAPWVSSWRKLVYGSVRK